MLEQEMQNVLMTLMLGDSIPSTMTDTEIAQFKSDAQRLTQGQTFEYLRGTSHKLPRDLARRLAKKTKAMTYRKFCDRKFVAYVTIVNEYLNAAISRGDDIHKSSAPTF